MNKVLLGVFMIVYSSAVFSSEAIETWECKEQYGQWTNILVKALVFKGRKRGEIQVAGITHDSSFEIQGFKRRWDFGGTNNKGIYKFLFIILPNGDAAYYEFGENENAKPSILMNCRQTK